MKILKAGTAYFVMIFALGFVLGTARVLMIAPRIGEFAATLVELPIILVASWIVSGWLIRRLMIGSSQKPRLLMGAVGFGLLLVVEPALGFSFGKSLAQQWADLLRPAGIAGLTGQMIFGLMPWLRLKAETTVRKS